MLKDNIRKLKEHKYFLEEVERESHGIPNQYVFKFPNGYGASVVPEIDYKTIPLLSAISNLDRDELKLMTFERLRDDFEIALYNKNGELDFNNELFSDVLRNQTLENTFNILNSIEKLE